MSEKPDYNDPGVLRLGMSCISDSVYDIENALESMAFAAPELQYLHQERIREALVDIKRILEPVLGKYNPSP
jgi:hypothetical protein